MGVIDKAVQWALDIAADDSHKYSQSARWGPHYDCSSFVITAYEKAGVPVKTRGANSTHDMKAVFIQCGFKDITSQINLSTGSGLKKGDVLLNTEHHAALVRADGGAIVHASSPSNGICTRGYYNKPWNCILRYTKDTSSSGTTKEYTKFPTCSLSENAIHQLASVVTREQGGDDELANLQEASQMCNQLEVIKKRTLTESNLLWLINKSGWYADGYTGEKPTQSAISAVKRVMTEGKRVIPRYVVEHDCFPHDAWNTTYQTDRSKYKKHETKVNQRPRHKVGNKWFGFKKPVEYTFYCFMGSKGDRDIMGYFKEYYEKYKNDVPYGSSDDGSETSYGDSEEKEDTVEWKDRRSENIHPILTKIKPIKGDGNFDIYADDIKITPYISDVAWSNSIHQLATTLNFTIARNDMEYLKDLIYTPNNGSVIRIITDREIFTGMIIEIDDSDKNTVKVNSADLVWWLNKTKQTYQFKEITATECLKKICTDIQINMIEVPNLPETIKHIYFDKTISEIISDILAQCEGDFNYDFTPEGIRIYKIGSVTATPSFRLSDNMPYVNSVDYTSGKSHTISLENMRNSIKMTSYKDHTYKELVVKQDRDSINKYGFLQEIISTDDESGAETEAVKQLAALNTVSEKCGFTVIENITDYTRAGMAVDYGGKRRIIKSTAHSIKNGIHYVQLELEGVIT